MRRFIFPFDKLSSDAIIIIYGCGYVGRQYISQCLRHHIKIKAVIDAYAHIIGTNVHDICVHSPHYLSEINSNDYDYIILATEKEQIANEMRIILQKYNVPEKKTIYDVEYYDEINTLYSPDVRTYVKHTFSWYGEDLIIKNIFNILGIRCPSYLDIGCNHPYDGNNTALLYLTGSHGINIDANDKCIDLMKKERPDDINICAGILSEEGEKDFYIVSEFDALNSFSKANIDGYYSRHDLFGGGRQIKEKKVNCYTLKRIIDERCKGVFPDLLDLDIEGMDEAVMSSYDFSKNGPSVLCVESHDSQVTRQMLEQGYIKYIDTFHNTIYLKKDVFDKVIVIE